MHQVTLK